MLPPIQPRGEIQMRGERLALETPARTNEDSGVAPGFEPEQVQRSAALVRAVGLRDGRRERRQGGRAYTFILGNR
jgi:hypothetical protein